MTGNEAMVMVEVKEWIWIFKGCSKPFGIDVMLLTMVRELSRGLGIG